MSAAIASNRIRPGEKRRGVAAVEFAVCLPVIVLFVLGTIEAANAIFVQQALTSAAYEAANVATAMGGNSQQAQASGKQVLTALGVNGATISISPTVTAETPAGTVVQVTCTAPLGANGVVLGYLPVSTLTARVRMTRL